MTRIRRALTFGLLPLGVILYFFFSRWSEANVSPALPLDLQIYLDAAQRAWSGVNPYQPFDIGTSWVYPPSALAFFAPLTNFPSGLARFLWAALSMTAGLGALAVAWLALRPRMTPHRQILMAGLVLFYAPLLETVTVGQVNCLVWLGLALFVLGMVDPRYEWLGDIGLAMAISIKITPVILLLIPLARRDWQRCARVGLGILALAVLSILLYGLTPWLGFLEILPRLFTGAPGVLNQSLGPSLRWILTRMAPGAPDGAASLLARLFSILVLLSWTVLVFVLRRRVRPLALVSLGIVVMTVSSSLLWYHHLVFLLPPFLWLTVGEEATRPGWPAQLAWVALALIQADRFFEVALRIPPLLSIAGYLALLAACLGAVRADLSAATASSPRPRPVAPPA